MRKLLVALAVTASLSPLVANAQYYRYGAPPPPRVLIVPQRDPLSGTTMMRVHNNSPYQIVHIESSNMQYGATYRWGTPLAGGIVPPGGVAVVDFGDHTNACLFYVRVTTSDGTTHVFGNIDVCHVNDIVIPPW